VPDFENRKIIFQKKLNLQNKKARFAKGKSRKINQMHIQMYPTLNF
jgi:hypothetical protein